MKVIYQVLKLLGSYICKEPACKNVTRQIIYKDKCLNQKCSGKMTAEYSEYQTNDTMRYLQGLFNVQKYNTENKQTSKNHPHEDEYARLQMLVDGVLGKSQYNKVDLGSIFGFMSKR